MKSLSPRPRKIAAAAIDGVALADAAQMRAHALLCQKRGACLFVHLELAVVDEREPREDVGARGNVAVEIVIEFPESRERAKGHVELSVRPLAGLTRHAAGLRGPRG